MSLPEPEAVREGGDPPCWAHLVDDAFEPNGARHGHREGSDSAEPPAGDVDIVADLARMARSATEAGAVWRHQTDDLSVNLVTFGANDGVAEHLNTEVDVLLVGIAGEGVVEVDGVAQALAVGQALVIPKGSRRAIQGIDHDFAYLSCHRRRIGLRPSR